MRIVTASCVGVAAVKTSCGESYESQQPSNEVMERVMEEVTDATRPKKVMEKVTEPDRP